MRQLPPTGAVERAGDDAAVGASDHQRAAPRDQPPAGRRLQPRPAFVGALQQRDIVGVLEVGHAHDPRGAMTRPAIVHGAELLDTEHVDATAGEGGSGRRAHRAEADDDHVVAIHGAERKHRLAVERVRSIYARRIGEQRAGDGDLDALRRRAEALGAETFYWDDQGNYHDADPESLRRVVEVLEADVATGERRTPAVVVGSGGTLSVGTGIDDAALTLADGTTVALDVTGARVDVPDPLPVGCHTLTLAGPGVEEATTIVTPPAEMPTSPALAGRAAMFAPAYALWEHDAPLPSFTHLASLGSMLPTLGVDALITLPLYAAFLDEPFDPSPYAPISRLHWNEAYLDDGWTAERARPAHRQPHRLARRRQAPARPAARRGRHHPRQARYRGAPLGRSQPGHRRLRPLPRQGRRRPDRRHAPDRCRGSEPPAGPVPLSRCSLAAARDRPGRLRPRSADRQPPAGLRDVGQPRPVRHRHGRRRAARHDVSRRPELGLPAAATRRSRTQRLRPVARRRAALRPLRLAAAHRPRPRGPPPVVDPRRRGPRQGRVRALSADHPARRDRRRGGVRRHDRRRRGSRHRARGDHRGDAGVEHARPLCRADPARCRVWAVPRGHGAADDPGAHGRRPAHPRHGAVRHALRAWRPRRLPTQAAARPRPPRRPVSSGAADGHAHPPRRLRCLPRLRRSRRPARRGHPAQHPRQGVADDLAAAAAPADVRDARRHRACAACSRC